MQLKSAQPAEQEPLELVDLPLPQPGAGQVRLQVKVCGVCHTDLHTVEGDIHPSQMPIVPGHQVVAVVDALGVGVTQLQIGDRVGLPWLYDTCGECEFCRRGEQNLCPKARFTGFDVDGGFAEYMLAEADFVLPLPPEISDEQAAPLLCAGIIGYRSLRVAGLQPGERLGLFGFGASAHLAIQVARYWDCEVYAFTRLAGAPPARPGSGSSLGRWGRRPAAPGAGQGGDLCAGRLAGAAGAAETAPGWHTGDQCDPHERPAGHAI